jgi:hypothetical protein
MTCITSIRHALLAYQIMAQSDREIFFLSNTYSKRQYFRYSNINKCIQKLFKKIKMKSLKKIQPGYLKTKHVSYKNHVLKI